MVDDEDEPTRVFISYAFDEDLFSLNFKNGEVAIFEMKMTKSQAEEFTAALIRGIKEVNLEQARQYQASLEAGNNQSQQIEGIQEKSSSLDREGEK